MKVSSYNRILVNERGSTLIEILVTIFVLTAGILVLMGMFPQGFTILRNSKNIGFASGLLKEKSKILEMRQENMPIAIIPCDDNGDSTSVINVNPNSGKPDVFVKSNGEYVATGGVYTRDRLLNSRRVIGESTVIPGGDYYTTANGEFYGGKYTLLFGPIDTTRDTNTGKLKRFVVYGSEMVNINNSFTSSNPTLEMWNDSSYSSYWTDGGDGRLYLAFLPYYAYTKDVNTTLSYDRIYKISYLVRHETTGQTFRKEGYIQVPKDYDGRWSSDFKDFDIVSQTTDGNKNLTTIGTGYVLLEDSLVVKRVFQEITPGNSFTSDPYQFIMADPVVGTLMFNPIGTDVFLDVDGDKKPLKAYIDYLIYDPRISVRDIQFPRNGDYDNLIKINLGLGAILSVGDPAVIGDGTSTDNPDEVTFEGLIKGTVNSSDNQVDLNIGKPVTSVDDLIINQSILMIDLATGLRVFPINLGDATTNPDIQIDYENGLVLFNTNEVLLKDWHGNTVFSNVKLTDRVIRFYYRTAEDWVLRMCKPPSTFILNTDESKYNVNNDLNWDEYGFIAGGSKVYFPQAYAGCDVLVDYETTSGKKIYGELARISDYPEKDTESSCFIKLKNNANTIISVSGSSIILGAYWRSGDDFKNREMLFDVFGK